MSIRKSWIRILIYFCISLVLTGMYLINPENILREDVLHSLKNSTLIFTLCAVLSIALFTNYVKGLKDLHTEKVSVIRSLNGDIYDKYQNSKNENIQEIISKFIIPLFELNSDAWDDLDAIGEVREALKDAEEQGIQAAKEEPEFVTRYLLRIEDELNELGILFIRRIVSTVHVKTIRETFFLIIAGIVATGFSYLLPQSEIWDFVIFHIASAILIFSIFELLILLSFLIQESKEELPEIESE